MASGVWPLYRFDPRRSSQGEPPLQLDSRRPKGRVADYLRAEARFRMVEKLDPKRFKSFLAESQRAAEQRYGVYSQLAGLTIPQPEGEPTGPEGGPAERVHSERV